MFRKISSSILAKLIAIYLLMAFLLIGVLGFTVASASKQELLNMRIDQISKNAESIRQLILLNGAIEKREHYSGIIQGVADECDGVIQIADGTGRILYSFFPQVMTNVGEVEEGQYLDSDVLKVVSQGKKYILKDYYNKVFDQMMSTVVIDVRTDDNVVINYIIVHARNSNVNISYSRLIERLLIPCIAVIGLGVVLIILLNYSITTPLVEMNSAVQNIKRGNYNKQVLVTSRDEVGQLAESFNAMAQELEKTDTMRKDFVANISHELRTPLTSINGFVQGLLDGTIPDSEKEKYLQIVLSESQRLSKLTREMLDLSRIESGKYKINISTFDINELLRRVIITLGNKIDEKDIDFRVDFQQERIYVNADIGCIEQVCVNLLDNAIKFTERGKAVTVTSTVSEGEAIVAIQDCGKGIEASVLEHIWDRFYTENKSRSGNKGMGLGLSIVKRLLAEHGRDIFVTSQVGVGTKFWFNLELSSKYIKKN